MHASPRLLDVVALLSAVPAHGLLRGQVGTVVEVLDGAYEVEFSDDEGKTYAELALQPDQLLVLHHRPQRTA
jgi:ribosomal protein L21E